MAANLLGWLANISCVGPALNALWPYRIRFLGEQSPRTGTPQWVAVGLCVAFVVSEPTDMPLHLKYMAMCHAVLALPPLKLAMVTIVMYAYLYLLITDWRRRTAQASARC
jgi:hypothetical protein